MTVLCGLRIVALFSKLTIVILQKKAARIINFQPRNFHIATSPLFKRSYLKFQDKTCLENILFVSKSLNNLSSSVFRSINKKLSSHLADFGR